ncbi:hypothetical protein PF006_g30005 [Phytophthora fragariae]|uniref:Uncharacterized protein n=1 Tax=Phytophthora fragariae TaxID=53985 RepID=A0A6A3Q308_9STRA|nr:hypothetical protein PF006_g30005 [Phytophthora fragariae]
MMSSIIPTTVMPPIVSVVASMMPPVMPPFSSSTAEVGVRSIVATDCRSISTVVRPIRTATAVHLPAGFVWFSTTRTATGSFRAAEAHSTGVRESKKDSEWGPPAGRAVVSQRRNLFSNRSTSIREIVRPHSLVNATYPTSRKIAMGFASAEDATDSNNNKRIALNKIIKRLRASREAGGEERAGAQVAIMMGAAQAANGVDYTSSTQNIVHSVKDNRT